MNINIYKEQFILIIFTLSIFFSHVKIFNFELRFSYLLLIFFMLADIKKNFSKFNLNYFIYSFIFSVLLLIHSIYNLLNFDFFEFEKILNVSLKILVFFLTINLVIFYEDILIKKISSMAEIFLFIFIIYIFYFVLIDMNNFKEVLFHCLSFFFFSKDVYSEVSHFHLMAIPIIFYFILGYEKFFKKKIIFLLYTLFLIFSFKNFSTLLFLGIICSTIILFLTCRSMNRNTFILLILINLISVIMFLNDKSCSKKILNEPEGDTAMISSVRDKLFKTGILSKEDKNFSYLIYINSLNVSIGSLKDNIFGIGFDNYKYAHVSDKYKDYSPGESEKNMRFREMNIQDGSTIFFKLTTEFGLFFIICVLFVIKRSFSNQFSNKQKAFFFTFLFLQTFFRGSGIFFNGYLIVSIIVINQLLIKYNKK